MKKINIIFLSVIGLAALLLFFSAYIVAPHEQVLVLKFGEPKRVIRTPGLKWRAPGIESLVYYDKRILDLDLPPEEIILMDKNRVVVDIYTRYRIADPLTFYKKARSVVRANKILADQISPDLRKAFARINFPDLLSNKRTEALKAVLEDASESATDLGVEILDIRIRRSDVPQQNSQAIYNRMNSERERIAKQLRAKGREEAQAIRAAADRESTVILADAKLKARTLEAEGDATAAELYRKSYAKDPDFYKFYRQLKAYEKSLYHTDKKPTLIVDPAKTAFLKKLVG